MFFQGKGYCGAAKKKKQQKKINTSETNEPNI